MSTVEETIKEQSRNVPRPKSASWIDRSLNFLSSVRFGVVLLCILVAFSVTGMIIVQQNVKGDNGFDAYYAALTPAEKLVLGSLGIFDIYHSWYFNFLLLVLSLNIILASIDRFPGAWAYIKKPKLTATREFLLRQKQSTVIEIEAENLQKAQQHVSHALKNSGFNSTATEQKINSYALDADGKKDFSNRIDKKSLVVFGQKGEWNRLGAYIVHVFLLTLFLGHFVALQTGFDADVRMTPGETTEQIELIQFNLDKQERFAVALPFTITCTDIQQNLIDASGSIDIGNTMDWRTQIKINDPAYGETVADVSLNKPFEYRGYRFFQASAITVGSARTMTLEVTPQNGGEPVNVELMRNGAATLPDGTKIEYEAFFPDFVLNQGKPDTRSANYNNPAAVLNITTADGEKKRAYAFGAKMPDNIPIGAPVAGYKWRLTNFEKSPLAHVLSIKYDPFNAAFIAWYIGGFGLIGALCFVFFIAHKRVWALIEEKEPNRFEVALGGDANRSEQAFEDKFKKIVEDVTGKAAKSS